MIDGVITFVTKGPRTRDAMGVYRDGETITREVFARVGSVTRSEFYGFGQQSYRPELQFTIFADEYQDEQECTYEGTVYVIYRTYRVPGSDDLELYVQRKAGVSNG